MSYHPKRKATNEVKNDTVVQANNTADKEKMPDSRESILCLSCLNSHLVYPQWCWIERAKANWQGIAEPLDKKECKDFIELKEDK